MATLGRKMARMKMQSTKDPPDLQKKGGQSKKGHNKLTKKQQAKKNGVFTAFQVVPLRLIKENR